MNSKIKVGRRGFLTGTAALGAAALAAPAFAQKYPAQDISWLIYQAPGGSIDTTARIIQPYLEHQGIKTTLDYVLGAGGRVARTKLYNAKADGYVIMTESAPGAAIDEIMGRSSQKVSDFIPLYGWNKVSWQLCVRKDSPIRTFKDFVDECKKRRVVVGTIGRGASSHIQVAAIQKELNLPMGLVHFEGSGKAYPAVMGGHVDVAIGGPSSGSRLGDNLHFLCVTGEQREPALPDVPTIREQGYTVTTVDQIWYAMTTPKVPQDRAEVLSNAFAKAFEDKMLPEQMEKAGEYVRLLNRPQILEILKAQSVAIERYKDLLA